MNRKSIKRLIVATIGLACTGLASAPAAALDATRLHEQIMQSLSHAISIRYPEGVYDIEVLPMARAISQRDCDVLQVTEPTTVLHGRVSVRVSCVAPKPWSFYAQAQVNLQLPVVVTTRAINRGEPITASDLTIAARPASQNRSSAITDLQDAVGLTARVSIARGKILSNRQLAVPVAVARGERVRIQASSGRVQIHTYGIAMRDGRIGDQIPVRNVSSERTIQPWVIGPGVVSTRPQ